MTNCTRAILYKLAAPFVVATLGLATTSCLDLTEHPITGITNSRRFDCPAGAGRAGAGNALTRG